MCNKFEKVTICAINREDTDYMCNLPIKEDTPLTPTTNIKVRTTTTKVNTPDEYHEDRKKLKAFLI